MTLIIPKFGLFILSYSPPVLFMGIYIFNMLLILTKWSNYIHFSTPNIILSIFLILLVRRYSVSLWLITIFILGNISVNCFFCISTFLLKCFFILWINSLILFIYLCFLKFTQESFFSFLIDLWIYLYFWGLWSYLQSVFGWFHWIGVSSESLSLVANDMKNIH